MKRRRKIYSLLFSAIFVIVFVAGLWPFSFFADNRVAWLRDDNGIEFYGPSLVYSVAKQSSTSAGKLFDSNKALSVEIWLQSNMDPHQGGSSILCFYDDKLPCMLTLGQWHASLDIRTRIKEPVGSRLYAVMGVPNVLLPAKKRFLTLTSGKAGTVVYVDGKIVKSSAKYRLLPDENASSSWGLVLGNDPSGKRPWKGKIFGLAIYSGELASGAVFENYQKWRRHDYSALTKKDDVVALYSMDEQSGSWIHNSNAKLPHLWIPERFRVLKGQFLEVDPMNVIISKQRAQDSFINVLGFVPVGFFGLALFWSMNSLWGSSRLSFLAVILMGSAMSLTIELLQVYLYSRHSSLTDLICNTLGTALGLVLFQALVTRRKNRDSHLI